MRYAGKKFMERQTGAERAALITKTGLDRQKMAGKTSAVMRIVGVTLVSVSLTACGGFQEEEKLDTFTPEQIFQKGELALETSNKPDKALRYFEEIERLYPYTQYARRALIMQAFVLHKARKYEEARGAAQRFLDFYPDDEDAPYAQYLMALSYYDQIEDVGRDQGLTFQALLALRDVIEKYPDSDYATSARLKFDLAFDHLAAKEMEIGRFYLKRRHYTAAINRFRAVVEDYQTTTHTAEALYRLTESYLALGLTNEAQTAAAILGHNYRSSPFYQDAYGILKGRGLTPEAKGNSWLTEIYRQTVQGKWL